MIRDVPAVAGLGDVHPHQLRRSTAHDNIAEDMSEGNVMMLMGWRSPAMLRRYGAAEAANRAEATFVSSAATVTGCDRRTAGGRGRRRERSRCSQGRPHGDHGDRPVQPSANPGRPWQTPRTIDSKRSAKRLVQMPRFLAVLSHLKRAPDMMIQCPKRHSLFEVTLDMDQDRNPYLVATSREDNGA